MSSRAKVRKALRKVEKAALGAIEKGGPTAPVRLGAGTLLRLIEDMKPVMEADARAERLAVASRVLAGILANKWQNDGQVERSVELADALIAAIDGEGAGSE